MVRNGLKMSEGRANPPYDTNKAQKKKKKKLKNNSYEVTALYYSPQ